MSGTTSIAKEELERLAHTLSKSGPWCYDCGDDWPCGITRLIAALAEAERAREEALAKAERIMAHGREHRCARCEVGG